MEIGWSRVLIIEFIAQNNNNEAIMATSIASSNTENLKKTKIIIIDSQQKVEGSEGNRWELAPIVHRPSVSSTHWKVPAATQYLIISVESCCCLLLISIIRNSPHTYFSSLEIHPRSSNNINKSDSTKI